MLLYTIYFLFVNHSKLSGVEPKVFKLSGVEPKVFNLSGVEPLLYTVLGSVYTEYRVRYTVYVALHTVLGMVSGLYV